MNPQVARCWLHRFALLTAIMTLLLPVTTGALVTTLKAGMAFEDWPSSDGHFILTYPWIGSARDQFVEHGHRLSGMTIGLLSIALAGLSLSLPTDRTSKFLGVLILVMVIVQGMLGGVRVLLDRETLALIHGDFAAAVFSVMSVLVMVTSNRWNDFAVKTVAGSFSEPSGQSVSPDFLKTVTNDGRSIVRLIGGLTFLSIAFQYFLGGLLRHLRVGWAWWLHPWFALVPLVLAVAFYVAVMRSRLDLAGIKRLASVLLSLIVAQALLGLMTWYFRYGVPSWGVVAQQESWQQVTICSLHKVLGMLTLMTSVLSVVCLAPRRNGSRSRNLVEFGASEPTVLGAAI